VNGDEIVIGRTIDVLGRQWGYFTSYGLALSRVTSEAVWYNGLPVRLYIGCTKKLKEDMACIGGGSRHCTRCTEWGVHAQSLDAMRGGGSRQVSKVASRAVEPVDYTHPCPELSPPADAQRAQAALAGREFMMEGVEEHPFFFRTRAACIAYRSQHWWLLTGTGDELTTPW
jgi:hypothetical protein